MYRSAGNEGTSLCRGREGANLCDEVVVVRRELKVGRELHPEDFVCCIERESR